MSARDDYPMLARSVSGSLYISDALDRTRSEGQRALNEIDRLRAECKVWMTAVADAVEPLGYDREAACGPADLLPGLDTLTKWRLAMIELALDAYIATRRP